MPVWIAGGQGEIEDHVISQTTNVLEDRETGWTYTTGFEIPEETYFAGENEKREEMFIARSIIDGDLVPGMIVPASQQSVFPHKGRAHFREDKHMLCGFYLSWANRLDDKIHPRAVVGGRTKDGQRLYIGRTTYKSTILIGKIDPTQNLKLFVPYNGLEVSVQDYEVLVHGS